MVYGTLKFGKRNHRVMGESEKLGRHVTEPIYTMRTNGSFPIVERGGSTEIKGEVYKVTDERTLKGIYALEGFTGIKGSAKNWYNLDDVDTIWGQASIFVMDKDSNKHLPILENGVF